MNERIPKGGDFGENKKAKDELKSFGQNHLSNLYDVNEDAAGETYDLATGKPIDNTSTDAAQAELTIIEPGDHDALPPLEDEDDAAAEFLKKHGG